MSTNKLSLEISPEKETAINEAVDKLIAEFDFLVGLVNKQRKGIAKMGRKHLDMVERSLKYAENNPKYLPNYRSLEEYQKDVYLYGWLRKVEKKMNLLSSNVKSTAMLAESEAYSTARVYYDNTKMAARDGDENAEVIANDLGIHFKKKSKKKEETTDNTNNNTDNTNSTTTAAPAKTVNQET